MGEPEGVNGTMTAIVLSVVLHVAAVRSDQLPLPECGRSQCSGLPAAAPKIHIERGDL